jgi:hypothetical protein
LSTTFKELERRSLKFSFFSLAVLFIAAVRAHSKHL